MPTVDVYNLDRQKTGSLDLSDTVFNVEVREHLFHEVVTAQLGAARGGNAKTKERNEIAGTTQKAWKQKGTGRARQGTKKAPQWVGGGVVHGPRPRFFGKKVNKKVKRAALCAALSRRQQEGRLVVVDDMALAAIKTKRVAQIADTFEVKSALLVDTKNDTMNKSARNLGAVNFIEVGQINVYDILRHETLFISKAAAQVLEQRIN